MTTHVKPVHLEASTPAAGHSNPGHFLPTTRIGRIYRFDGSSSSTSLEGHRCRNLHGHNYRVEVVVSESFSTRGDL